MNKSEKLKSKIKIKFKCFLLANILTLFFAVVTIAFASDLPAEKEGNPFYSEPFSKLIEFLNAKKNELEKIRRRFFGSESFSPARRNKFYC